MRGGQGSDAGRWVRGTGHSGGLRLSRAGGGGTALEIRETAKPYLSLEIFPAPGATACCVDVERCHHALTLWRLRPGRKRHLSGCGSSGMCGGAAPDVANP